MLTEAYDRARHRASRRLAHCGGLGHTCPLDITSLLVSAADVAMLVVPRTQALSGAPSTSGAEATVEVQVLIGTAMGSSSEGEAFRLLRARCAALGTDGGGKFVFRRHRGGVMRGQHE